MKRRPHHIKRADQHIATAIFLREYLIARDQQIELLTARLAEAKAIIERLKSRKGAE